jgi:uncharacterized lipoprotein YajG
MRVSVLLLLLAAWLPLAGCAPSSTGGSATPDKPLPDARDLSENPLDVIGLPQP